MHWSSPPARGPGPSGRCSTSTSRSSPCAGLMPFPRDGKPLIGRIPGRDNLWIVTGLASSGFGRGPMAGKLLADYLHTGTPAPVLVEADPARCIRERAHTLEEAPCSPIE